MVKVGGKRTRPLLITLFLSICMCAWKCDCITDSETESNKALGKKENKVGLEEIKKTGKWVKSKHLPSNDWMQRQSPWQHSSPTVSGFHSWTPLAMLTGELHRHPPTVNDYDMFCAFLKFDRQAARLPIHLHNFVCVQTQIFNAWPFSGWRESLPSQ